MSRKPISPNQETTYEVMMLNTGDYVNVPASNLMMNMPSSNNLTNKTPNNLPSIGGKRRRNRRRKSRKIRK